MTGTTDNTLHELRSWLQTSEVNSAYFQINLAYITRLARIDFYCGMLVATIRAPVIWTTGSQLEFHTNVSGMNFLDIVYFCNISLLSLLVYVPILRTSQSRAYSKFI